jgi:hypothetical protein
MFVAVWIQEQMLGHSLEMPRKPLEVEGEIAWFNV